MLIPSFTTFFSRGAVAYESHGSFCALLFHTLSLRGFSRISQHFRLPLPDSVRKASRFNLPRSFLLINIIVTAVYTVGISAGRIVPSIGSSPGVESCHGEAGAYVVQVVLSSLSTAPKQIKLTAVTTVISGNLGMGVG
jgi:hypothetical protein